MFCSQLLLILLLCIHICFWSICQLWIDRVFWSKCSMCTCMILLHFLCINSPVTNKVTISLYTIVDLPTIISALLIHTYIHTYVRKYVKACLPGCCLHCCAVHAVLGVISGKQCSPHDCSLALYTCGALAWITVEQAMHHSPVNKHTYLCCFLPVC